MFRMKYNSWLTNGTEQTQEQQKDDTVDDVTINAALQLTPFVPRITVVQHSFGFMP